jgi:hypothetical protein
MSVSRIPRAVQRVFLESFSACDVAEPLASFDSGTSCKEVRDFMDARGFDVIGVREQGEVSGYVEKASLGDGTCGQYRRAIDGAMVLTDTASLLDVLMGLNSMPFLLVTVLGKVGGIITPADLQKPAVRMWLFGLVTMIEMRFAELIEQHCPGDTWQQYLSPGRVQKAQDLLAERRRRNQALELVDCLQFSDKGQIIARNEGIRQQTVFASRSQAEEVVKSLEQLRNNLAHAQDIVTTDWATIVRLCKFIAQQRSSDNTIQERS